MRSIVWVFLMLAAAIGCGAASSPRQDIPPDPGGETWNGTRRDAGIAPASSFATGDPRSQTATGLLAVSVRPSRAHVLIDGEDRGRAPLKTTLTVGEHDVRLTCSEAACLVTGTAGKNRYADISRKIVIVQGQTVELREALPVVVGRGTFHLHTPNARAFLVFGDGSRKEIPQFPIAIDFDTSERFRVEAHVPGRSEDYVEEILFNAGEAARDFEIRIPDVRNPN